MHIVETCKSRSTVRRRHPSAAAIAKVEGGWAVFEFYKDYIRWRGHL